VSRRGDREAESFRRTRGAVSAEWALFGASRERSVLSMYVRFSKLTSSAARRDEGRGKGVIELRHKKRNESACLCASARETVHGEAVEGLCSLLAIGLLVLVQLEPLFVRFF
jgi:hypothetical protein